MSRLNRFSDIDDQRLDEAIREALRRQAGAAEPPAHVWLRIKDQVSAGPLPARRRSPALSLNRLLAPLMQGLAATVVLLLLGLSLGFNLWPQTYQFGASNPVAPTEPGVAAVESATATLAMWETGTGLANTVDDMLNTGAVLRYERVHQPAQRPALIQANRPELDPVLMHLRKSIKPPGRAPSQSIGPALDASVRGLA